MNQHLLFGLLTGFIMILMSFFYMPTNAWQSGLMGGLAAVVAMPIARLIMRK